VACVDLKLHIHYYWLLELSAKPKATLCRDRRGDVNRLFSVERRSRFVAPLRALAMMEDI